MKISKNVSSMLKGLAALFVLINHLIAWGDTFDFNPMVVEMTARFSDLGMFSFLFISGYGLYVSFSNSGLNDYWEKKVKHIYIPMLFANCIGAIAYNIDQGQIPKRGDVFRGIVSIVLDYNGIMWYIHYLFVWYFLFWMVEKIVKKKNVQVIIWIIIAIFMLYMTPETYGLANEYCLAFPLGVITCITAKSEYFSKKQNVLLGIFGMIVAVFYFRDGTHSIGGIEVNFFMYCILINVLLMFSFMAIMQLLLIIEEKQISDPFIKMGNYSLGIYLLQEPVILYMMKLTNKKSIEIVIIIVGCGVCILLSNIYKKTVAKIL